MPVPIALVAPAAVAGALYLNAKTSFSYDCKLVSSFVIGLAKAKSREKMDRLNIFYTLEEHVRNKKVANTTFIIFEGRRWTYRQVYETVLKYGTWLKTSFNIKPQGIVAVNFQNSEKFIFIWLGLWSIGARPAFINYSLTGKALAHCIRVSTARLVLVDPNVWDNVTDEIRGELPDIKFVVFTPQLEVEAMTITAVREPDSARTVRKLQDMAMLIYTSGTTGLPKPAVVSWSKSIVGPHVVAMWLGLTKADVFYTCMPLYHSSASILGFLTLLCTGSTFALGRKFSTRTFWLEVRDSNATAIQYIGETCRYLLSAPPQVGPLGENLDKENKVRLAFGNGLRPEVWNKFKERFGIGTVVEFYSATEASEITLNYSRNDFTMGAVGRMGILGGLVFGPATVVEVNWETEQPLRDGKGFCKKVKMGERGELLYALDAKDVSKLFQGYFNNDEATNSKVMTDVFKKGDAYFKTGDVVRIDPEGRMYFQDRIGDTYRWKSENVSTSEVADTLGGHPAVQEANVYGVELPHHDGRAGCVALVLTEDPSPRLMSSLAEHAYRELPRFAVPLFLRTTKNMEVTGTNKQQKHLLRAQGVEPRKMGEDSLYWLKNGTYVKFSEREWRELKSGKVKL